MASDYVGLLERARQHREQFERGALERARQADISGYRNPNMFSNEMRTQSQLNAARFAAQASPAWDAWFQAAQEGGWQAPRSRVRPGRAPKRASTDITDRQSLAALRGLL